jgi:hypothetical protein
MRKVYGVGMSVLAFTWNVASGQSSDMPMKEQQPKYPAAIVFFAPLFFPKVLQDEYRLKEFICSDSFIAIRRTKGDLQAVDELFSHALQLSWNNVYEALLLSFVCSLEHRNFGLKLPVLGSLLWFPLTSEFPEDFASRVRSLPTQLYPDTPGGPAGDRDKLQHFFGSAFLTYVFESGDASERVGMFIEWGEDKFVVEGSLDDRDIRSNIEGQHFAEKLLEGAAVVPSDFIGEGMHDHGGKPGCVPDGSTSAVSTLLEER